MILGQLSPIFLFLLNYQQKGAIIMFFCTKTYVLKITQMIGIQNTEKIGLHGEIDNHQISQYFWKALTIYSEIRYIAEENIIFIYSI